MADTSPFSQFVPGFDFLQGLVSNAGAALPGIGQWVAPTLNPQELEKRISELRTVQFWLEQNARMLGATIQALEVQRMTLSTLKTMNVQMEDLRESLTIKTPSPAAPPSAGGFFGRPAEPASAAKPAAEGTGPETPPPPPGVDPMQWWGALTQQFTQLATQAMQQSTADVGKHLAGGLNPEAPATPKPKASATPAIKQPGAAAKRPAPKASIKTVSRASAKTPARPDKSKD
jgi:hypothetical protein